MKSGQPSAIEIFRAGKHTTAAGEALTFAEADLAATAAAYDPKIHEAPIVVGHPQQDAPAYGWIAGLAAGGSSLQATPSQVDPAFAELVEEGRFKKVSASFYRPTAAGNPKPGVWYLRHVGFLGAQPPALKGLKPIQFADDGAEAITVEFDELEVAWSMTRVARLFRSLRDFLIGEFGQEKADKALDAWDVNAAAADATRAQIEADKAVSQSSFSEPQPKDPNMPPVDNAAADELARREKELAAREAAFAETSARAAAETFIEQLVAAGRVLPAEKPGLVAFMAKLDDKDSVAFAEGAEKQTPAAFFKAFLGALPKRVEFGEIAGPGQDKAGSVEFAAPAGFTVDAAGLEIHAKAIAHQQAHPAVAYLDAVKAVGGQ